MKKLRLIALLTTIFITQVISYGQVYVNEVDLNSEVKLFELHLAKRGFSTKDCYYIDYGQKDFKEQSYDNKSQAVFDKNKIKFEKGEYIRLLNYLDAEGWIKDSLRESKLGDIKITIILFKRKQ